MAKLARKEINNKTTSRYIFNGTITEISEKYASKM